MQSNNIATKELMDVTGQYKNKHSFGIISTSEQHLNVHHITNYSASGHGKGEVDQAAGFLKTAAKRAVIANTDTYGHLKCKGAL